MDVEVGTFLTHLYLDTAKVALASTAAAVAAVWWKSVDNGVKLPPGPRGYPIVGNSLEYAKAVKANKLSEYQLELHEKFGDVISLQIGSVPFICIKNGELVRKLFNGDDFSERPVELMPLVGKLSGPDGGGGICLNNGATHAEMRKLTLSTFRDLGVGKRTLDELLQTECSNFTQYLEKVTKENGGVIYDLKSKVQQVAANVIHNIVLGSRYEYDDEKWLGILEQFTTIYSANLFGYPENFIPALKYVPFLKDLIARPEMKKMYAAYDKLRAYLKEQIDEHRATYTEGETRDFIDLFIMNELKDSDKVDMESLFMVILDVFRAGAHSTSSALAWCLQYLVQNQDIQEEIRREIDENVGDQIFQKGDKTLLVKTQAFVYEVLRVASIAPTTGPHTVRKPTRVGEYIIPANCVVFASLYSMHHDKTYWGDPETFRISRWIDANGEIIKHEDNFFPFSTGKRVCIGKQLASIELIQVLVHILQRFRFERPDGINDMTDAQVDGHMRAPHSCHIKVVPRV